MFWGSVSWSGVGIIHLVEESLTGARYGDLLEEVIPDTLANLNMGHPFLLEDNAPAHASKIVNKVKNALGLRRLEKYPSNSPDLNPIEHVRFYLKDKVRERKPQSLEELEIIVYQEWENISLNFIRDCIGSMPQRLTAVINSKGLHTKY